MQGEQDSFRERSTGGPGTISKRRKGWEGEKKEGGQDQDGRDRTRRERERERVWMGQIVDHGASSIPVVQ